MIIESSSVSMRAEHEKSETRLQMKELDLQAGSSAFEIQLSQASSAIQLAQVDLSIANGRSENSAAPADNAIMVMTDEGFQFRTGENKNEAVTQQELTRAKLLQCLLDAINQHGKCVSTSEPLELPDVDGLAQGNAVPEGLNLPTTVEMSFKVFESVEEYESSNFASSGVIKTADGREMAFLLELGMTRSYSETREYQVTEQVVLKDPLILNFAGNHAELSDTQFEFDLDADGDNELISYLLGDSGMLALDKNGDGSINDGSELFGALSGNGFADLAAYDEDNNHYIDEADSIFSDLKIWTRSDDGETLQGLADRGVGAIYLGATETPFTLKGEANETLGQVRASGFYLTEAGDVGTVQQIDMAV